MPEEQNISKDVEGQREEKNFAISFHTLGCKVNRYETDAVRQAFAVRGFRIASEKEHADVFVINTCTVTSEADRKSRQMIRRARRRNPNILVVAMGCQIELRKSSSEADISVGTRNRLSVVDQVIERLMIMKPETLCAKRKPNTAQPVKDANRSDALDALDEYEKRQEATGTLYQEFGTVISQEDTRAYIKIEDGCDSFCSYCIIPYARGRVASRFEEDILREAMDLGDHGFREIVLTGIHICAYGKDRGEGVDSLLRLLLLLDKIPAIHRIRLGSLEPNSLTLEFVKGLSAVQKLCPHFHVSLQSGSDPVLVRMNRKYVTEEYRSCISMIHAYFPCAAISTDVIVAFPGETEEEHADSMQFCTEIGFSRIHVFPFSSRSGTRAADMSPKVPSETAALRTKQFLELSFSLAQKYCMTFVGRRVEVLLETTDAFGYDCGYSKEYLKVHVAPNPENCKGSEVRAVILSTNSNELYGTITD